MRVEEWKDIPGYEGLYQASTFGQIRSLDRRVSNRSVKGVILKQHSYKTGYNATCLCKNGSVKTVLVHRIIAKTFIDNPNNLPTVNHKDEVKTNNSVDNLEWCTSKENTNYGTCISRRANTHRGKKHKPFRRRDLCKRVVCMTKNDEIVAEYESISQAQIESGIKFQNISSVCLGKAKSAGGYKWKYICQNISQ